MFNDDLPDVPPLPRWSLCPDPALDGAQLYPNPFLQERWRRSLQWPNFGLKNPILDSSTTMLMVMLFSRCLGTCFQHDCSTTYKVHGYKNIVFPASASKHWCASSVGLKFSKSWKLHGLKHGRASPPCLPKNVCLISISCRNWSKLFLFIPRPDSRHNETYIPKVASIYNKYMRKDNQFMQQGILVVCINTLIKELQTFILWLILCH